jgi:hypothetical protein
MKFFRLRSELWLSVGSVILALILGEVAARKFLLPPARVILAAPPPGTANNPKAMRSLHRADPLLGWVLNPGPMEYEQRLVSKEGAVEYDVRYTVADGQRRTSANPPAGPVVIATGCSFTFGHGVNDGDSWPWLLQERLPNYHVVNVGTMGYGTDQALLAAERQLKRFPHQTAAVVLGLGTFQIDRNRSTQGWMVFVYPFSKPLFAVGPNGVEYKGQVRVWSPPLLSKSDLFAHAMNVMANRILYKVPSHEQAKQLTVALVRDFAERFRKLGVRLAVAVLPYADDYVAESRADRAYLIEGLQAAGIPVLVPDFPRLSDGKFDVGRLMVSKTDRHPNGDYNRRLVDQMYPFLETNGIVSVNEPGESRR